jgi:lactate dehydrogenase-like 2-hydroxyacid dehydrogenase
MKTEKNTPKLLVTRKLMESVETAVSGLYTAQFNASDQPTSAESIIAAAKGCDGLMVTSMDKFPAAVLNALPASVKIIATVSVGHEHIDLAAAKARGITVTNTPGVLTEATADIALLLLLGAARGAYWGERMVREKTWAGSSIVHPLGSDFTGQRLGILGMGRIGQAVARRAQGFGMALHYHNRKPVAAPESFGATFHASLEAMLPHCDFLSINCAMTPETKHLINAERIALLPKGAIVVNSARGDIVHDDALIQALQSGHLAAAGLDVFSGEPNIDPRYRDMSNVFLLPHLGSATPRTRSAMGFRALDNLNAFFAGQKPGDALV